MTTLPPQGEPEPLIPDLTPGEEQRLLNDMMDACHRARLFPLENEVVLIVTHRNDEGRKSELMLASPDVDPYRLKGVLMTLIERLP